MSDGFLRPPGATVPDAAPGAPGGTGPAPSHAPTPPSLTAPGTPASSPTPISPTAATASASPRPWLWVHTAHPNPLDAPTHASTNAPPASAGAASGTSAGAASGTTAGGSAPMTPPASRAATTPGQPRPSSFPPARVCHEAPRGLEMTGGSSLRLDGAVTLDRLASGYGALTISWSLTGPGHDLLALADGTRVEPRGDEFVIDLLGDFDRVLVCTGTARGVELPESTIVVSNGATRIECRLPAGTSYGVWPRLSLVRVDEFVVLLDEHDPSSGELGPVAAAYGHDTATFVRAGR